MKPHLGAFAMAFIALAAMTTQQSQPSGDASLDEELTKIDERAAMISDLTADFVQLKHTALLKQPLESRGSLRVKGAAMRWDTRSPSVQVMTVDEHEMRLYSKQERLLEIYPMQRGVAQIAASPLPRLNVVREHFSIEREPVKNVGGSKSLAIRLTPREDALRRYIREVHVQLDSRTGCSTAVQIIDSDGERLELTFKNIQVNTGLRDEDVRFTPPADTRISRPLEPESGADKGQDLE